MITVSYINFWQADFDDIFFTKFLRKYIDETTTIVKPTEEPDILFASCMGPIERVINTRATCKIFYYGENLNRDCYKQYSNTKMLQSVFDLLIGFIPTDSSNKIFRFPLWLLYYDENMIDHIESSYKRNLKGKKLFATLVASHDMNGVRTQLYDAMSKIGTVRCPGKFMNNIEPLGPGSEAKIAYTSRAIYSICPENSEFPGYCTEKIFEALEAGTVPIYWGVGLPEPDLINENKYHFCKGTASIGPLKDYMTGNVFKDGASDIIKKYYTDFKEHINRLVNRTDNVYRSKSESAIGNLSLSMATHAFRSIGKPQFHSDCLLYGKNRLLEIPYVVDTDVPVNSGHGYITGFVHLQYPLIGQVMNRIIQPTELLKGHIDRYWAYIRDCVAGFHIRRGLSAEDSKQFGYLPFASDKAVDSMVKEALELDAPVYMLSDSVSTKEYFKSRVPKAITLDIEIGFTADEHSQKMDVFDENFESKMNSMAEWFLLSKMPKVYMTAGGINGRNVDETVEEGITSTFGYTAALYGGKIPWYVFNDGYVFYPDGKNGPQKRYCWSDM
jgi:hypothetical protein